MIPLMFSSWIVPNEMDRMIFTTVSPSEIWPVSYLLTYNIEYHGIVHALFGFRTCYMLCMYFNSAFVQLVKDVWTDVRNK